jgi:hypothetical protein
MKSKLKWECKLVNKYVKYKMSRFVLIFFLCSGIVSIDYCKTLGYLLRHTIKRKIEAPRSLASRLFNNNNNIGLLPDLYEEYDPSDFLGQYQEVFRENCQQVGGIYLARPQTSCKPSFDLHSKGFEISHIIEGSSY